MTEEELQRLLEAARTRPLHDALHKNRGDKPARLSPSTKRKLELLGRERELVYKTLFLTGLRKSELKAIRLADTDFVLGVLHLAPKHEKNRQGSTIPLREDLVLELRDHIRDRARFEREEAMRKGKSASFGDDLSRPL